MQDLRAKSVRVDWRFFNEAVETRRASGRFTPALTIEASTRQNRSTSANWIVSPSTGTLSRNASRA